MDGRRGHKAAESIIAEAAETYKEEVDEGIQKLIYWWEDQVKNELEPDDEIEVWRTMVPDLGTTRGWIT